MITQLTAAFMAATIAAPGAGDLFNWPERAAVWSQASYSPGEREFSADFPVTPQVAGQPAINDDAPAYHTYEARQNGRAFLVRIDEYPRSIRVPDPSTRAYELLLRVHAAESASKLVSVTPARLADRPGMQGVYANAAGALEERRVLMIGHKVYQVSYTRPDGAGSPAEGDAFLDSFRITAP
jgi:hypothetical protein